MEAKRIHVRFRNHSTIANSEIVITNFVANSGQKTNIEIGQVGRYAQEGGLALQGPLYAPSLAEGPLKWGSGLDGIIAPVPSEFR